MLRRPAIITMLATAVLLSAVSYRYAAASPVEGDRYSHNYLQGWPVPTHGWVGDELEDDDAYGYYVGHAWITNLVCNMAIVLACGAGAALLDWRLRSRISSRDADAEQG